MVSPKRSLSPDKGVEPSPKRARVDTSSGPPDDAMDISETPEILGNVEKHTNIGDAEAFVSSTPSLHSQSRLGIQRSIAMVLQHDGFQSATPEALEGFTQVVETCM